MYQNEFVLNQTKTFLISIGRTERALNLELINICISQILLQEHLLIFMHIANLFIHLAVNIRDQTKRQRLLQKLSLVLVFAGVMSYLKLVWGMNTLIPVLNQ